MSQSAKRSRWTGTKPSTPQARAVSSIGWLVGVILARPLLFRQYEHELSRVLGDLYGRINTLLADIPGNTRCTSTSAKAVTAPCSPASSPRIARKT